MTRYYRFDYEDYEARGGCGDLTERFDTLVEAKAAPVKECHAADILDAVTGDVYSSDGPLLKDSGYVKAHPQTEWRRY